MRLLHKLTHELKWFVDGSADFPKYLILSHRWIGQETSFQQFEAEKWLPEDQWSSGTAKIKRFCTEALAYSPEYVWIDTCCIDKTSSAELQEAINSMYRWYAQSTQCLIYLEDVDTKSQVDLWHQFEHSLWFTRGWTLQELLAPQLAVFVDRSWNVIGYKDDGRIMARMASVTSIKRIYFTGTVRPSSAPVATIMSWMADRRTSRIEDRAYCLLGLLDINMTMLYGEGEKAFQRLLRKILRHLDDESVHLWLPTTYAGDYVTALASSPDDYACCRGVNIQRAFCCERDLSKAIPRGLEFEVSALDHDVPDGELKILLNCSIDGRQAYFRVRKNRDSKREFFRLDEDSLCVSDNDLNLVKPFKIMITNVMASIGGTANARKELAGVQSLQALDYTSLPDQRALDRA